DLRPELLDSTGSFGGIEPAGQGLLVVEVDQDDPLVAPARGRGEDVGAAVAGELRSDAAGLTLPFKEGVLGGGGETRPNDRGGSRGVQLQARAVRGRHRGLSSYRISYKTM